MQFFLTFTQERQAIETPAHELLLGFDLVKVVVRVEYLFYSIQTISLASELAYPGC